MEITPAVLPYLAPGACYFAGDDHLRVTVLNALTGVTVRVAGRFLHCEAGEAPRVEPFVHTLIPASDRSPSVLTRRLGTGWLLQVQAIASVGTPITGQTFAQISIVRGYSGGVDDLATLAAGYVTAIQRCVWPGDRIHDSLDGGGAIRSITGTVPAAGAEISETVPTGARWELIALRAQLVTDANAANRVVRLLLDDGALIFGHSTSNLNQTATLTYTYGWTQGLVTPFVGQVNALFSGFAARNRLLAGHRIRTVTAAIQATDQYSLVQYLVREWLEA